ncbi:PTS ascorbate transporter subunit IIC [Halanaerocella petrolearia]
MGVINVFVKQILGDPAVLIGLVALVGLIIQKEKLTKVVSGTLKTTIGFLIIGVGAGAVVGALAPMGDLLQETLNVKGVVPNNEAVISIAMKQVGTQGALIMIGGFIVNLILARMTRYKYIFLTGHIMLYISLFLAAVLVSVAGFSGITLVVIGSLCAGLYFTFMPALTQPFMRKIKGHDNIAFGHTGAIGNVISGWLGNLFKEDTRDAEEIELPEGLSFFRDSTVSMAITMAPIFLILTLLAGPENVQENISNGTNFIVFSLMHGFEFAAGVTVILSGVRMMLGEIVPAFEGISQKVVPGARPALDCPIIFNDAPTALLIGFLSSTVGTIIGMFILILFNAPIIILPAIVPAFFAGGAAGVFGNSTGGWKGAILGSFVGGVLLSLGTAILIPMSGMLEQAGTTFGDPFYAILGPIFTGLLHLIGG